MSQSTNSSSGVAIDEEHGPPSEEVRIPMAGPNEEEKEIINRQLVAPTLTIGYFALFRYANMNELIIMVIALVASIAAGATMPLMTLVYGNFTASFTSFSVHSVAAKHFQDQINQYTLYFVYLGFASFIMSWISFVGFSYSGERITQQIRELYLRAIFRQNIAFFDFLGPGEVTTRISSDMNIVQDGIGHKIGLFITGVSTFVCAIIIGFIRSWKLSLIMLSGTVALLMIMGLNGTMMKKTQTLSMDEYATAASLAEEILASARNVAAYGTQNRFQQKYKIFLDRASNHDFKAKLWLSLMIADVMAILNLQYALAFWQGNRFLHNGELGVSSIVTVVMVIMTAGFSIGSTLPHIQAFGAATAAANKVFNTIERKSPIDPESDDGDIPESFVGNIEFKNVRHIYPSRPDTTVLTDFNLKVPSGKMIALVGASGSGKSTIIGLLERFYLPVKGQILLDDKDITTLNLRWLRQHMAVVSQEPVLFSTTIYDSIAHGLVNTEYADASKERRTELIERAARIANAHDFISNLPEKYQTKVGERGNLLSGGQKQRIAIARAVVSDPKILLLDEATAALDTKLERTVQEALDRAAEGRTTIVIAHRLSTIKQADNIVVMSKGRIVEQGTHDELCRLDCVYASLVQAQELISKINTGNRMSVQIDPEKEDVIEESEKPALARAVTSIPSMVAKTPEKEEGTDHSTWALVKFTWKINTGEHMTMAIGLIFSFLAGCDPAIQAIFLGNSINSLLSPGTSLSSLGVGFWCWMFFMLGLVNWLFHFAHGLTLSRSSARLIGNVRQSAFAAMLRQDMEFYDSDMVTSGALANFLSLESNRLAGLSGSTLGTIVSAVASVFVAIIVGCAFGWKLALVCTSTIPLVLACGYFRIKAIISMEKRTNGSSDAASFACETASSIRTVATLSLEKHLLHEYHGKLGDQARDNLRFMNVSGGLFALSEGLILLILAFVFWYGGGLMLAQEYTVLQFFTIYLAIIGAAQSAGTIFTFAPDMGEARKAAALLKSFVNRVPKIDHWSTNGKNVNTLSGKIQLQDVRFTYPGRPHHSVLHGISICAEPGQFVALVGASGSGKSTVLQLLERFYDPTRGAVFVDEVDLKDYNLQDYRAQLAIVSQETTLYTGTIRENVLADKEDVSDDAVIQACKDANIYEFVMSLPDGFNTLVGAKGALLSGGQRQRIAIARALLRNPKVLLLDEATSALDSASERVVQAALDLAARGRTTIAIAHRLSTIQHADVIYVFDQGNIVEKGKHEELVKKKGVYWELAKLQAMGAPQF
ncbi:P-loop containing nucleoside triphosphate hydrolase protein [Lindgomyces ingoldianus]|uniref:P-loop containing nucleoside triphosphate hydrolase protein n=1 Tax=Lindgomyces ingoldianus TaxID=673940 RepID=A0ACB6QAL8_9PLEO|nr:P-loop containing nucleoside triphosphate hydrolase protein [Lindgomyces ingoldianus]KAF2463974.1 P-loop containing nucleoside triphosphate hydrolase protein [Lindgomyces ingoldianus]